MVSLVIMVSLVDLVFSSYCLFYPSRAGKFVNSGKSRSVEGHIVSKGPISKAIAKYHIASRAP